MPKPHPVVATVLDAVASSKLSDYAVSDQAGVSPRTLASWRAGQSPSLAKLIKVAEVVGVRVVAKKGRS